LEDVHAFQVHLVARGISWPALNQIVCALRFFYGVTLGHPTIPERIAYAREPASCRSEQARDGAHTPCRTISAASATMASSPMADATIKSPSAVNSLLSATLPLINKAGEYPLVKCEIPVCPHCGGTMQASMSFREPARATIRFVVIRHDQRLHHPPTP
jgi:hypothetical protein